MRVKPILNVLGALLALLGITMIVPILISYFSIGSDLLGLIKSSLVCILTGFPLWFCFCDCRPCLGLEAQKGPTAIKNKICTRSALGPHCVASSQSLFWLSTLVCVFVTVSLWVGPRGQKKAYSHQKQNRYAKRPGPPCLSSSHSL